MDLTVEQAYVLLEKFGVYAREACDKCGQLLGAVRYTRTETTETFCSKECRDGGERQVIRRGGRPRKYATAEQRRAAKTKQQQMYRTRPSASLGGGVA